MPENDANRDQWRRHPARFIGPALMVAVALLMHAHFTDWGTQCEPPSMLYLWESGPTSDLEAPCPAGYYFGLMPAPEFSIRTALAGGIVLPVALLLTAVLRVWRIRRERLLR